MEPYLIATIAATSGAAGAWAVSAAFNAKKVKSLHCQILELKALEEQLDDTVEVMERAIELVELCGKVLEMRP
jgi:hypothetical protein